jgi:hypothetical protein
MRVSAKEKARLRVEPRAPSSSLFEQKKPGKESLPGVKVKWN